MFTTKLVLSGLKRQHSLLDELIVELERKPKLDFEDSSFLEERTNRIVKNLQQLRSIKDQYASYLESMINLD